MSSQEEFQKACLLMDRLIDHMSDEGLEPESAFAGALTMLAFRLIECSEDLETAAEMMNECINSAAIRIQLGDDTEFVFGESTVH
tara:strand:- start:203 stop:457 length:255 start_codon:yes stop_codon:yes gene_type:complete